MTMIDMVAVLHISEKCLLLSMIMLVRKTEDNLLSLLTLKFVS